MKMKQTENTLKETETPSRGKGIWKLLLAVTGCFLCLMIGMHLGSQSSANAAGYVIQAEIAVPLEETAPPVVPVNINTATAEELDELPGIGPALAEAIIQYRTEHGSFASEEELIQVSGIGESKLAGLAGQITVGETG